MASHLSASADAKIPQLASASGSGAGASHALWRPQMQTFLMRQGIEERDYAREIAQWRELAAAVSSDADADEQDAIALILSGAMLPVKKEAPTPEQVKAKQRVADLIGRSRKAYGYLYAALSVDLRPLVSDVPQGYAYGIWSFLEKKFRNTEQDSVMTLWERIMAVRQETDETFDVYKARVDSIVELLSNAKQQLPPGLYASILLLKLQQPRYSTAVLTLQTGDRLKDEASIDWSYIAQYMAKYERNQLSLGDVDGSSAGDRALVARSQPSRAPNGGKPPSGDHSNIECFKCHKLGHYRSRCPMPDRRQKSSGARAKRAQQEKARGREFSRSPARGASSSASEADSGDEKERASAFRAAPSAGGALGAHKLNMARHVSRFAALASSDDSQEAQARDLTGRSYLARVLVGLKSSARLVKPKTKADDVGSPPTRPATVEEKQQPKKQKHVTFRPKTEAKSRESDRRAPARQRANSTESLDTALRTTAKAIDSGATISITGTKNNLINVQRCAPMPVLMGDDSVVSAVFKGDMPMRLPVADKPGAQVSITIRDVYYHPRIAANLLSWGRMREDGWEMHSTPAGTYVLTPKGTRINASTRGRLTILDDVGPERAQAARMGRFVCRSADELMLLHQRVGHPSWSRLLKMCRTGVTDGLGDISGLTSTELRKAEDYVTQCTACATGKQHRNALGHRGLDKGTRPGEVLHMDVFYVMMRDPQTNRKYREYCLLGTDAYTELRWVAATKTLHDLQAEVIQMIRNSTTANDRRPRLIVTDLGSEFDNRKVQTYCSERGIHLQPTPARAKELNGVAEKSVDTVKNHMRAMLLAANMPEQLGWMRAVAHHVYLWNRTHVGANTGVTPYQATIGREPSIINVGVFACDAFVHQDRTQRDTTFSPKAEPGVYLGHDFRQNCPVVYMLRTGKTVRVKDVIFRERSFEHLRADLENRAAQVPSLDLADLEADDEDAERKNSARSSVTTEVEGAADSELDDVGAESSDVEDEDDDVQHDAPSERRYTVKAITDQRTNPHGQAEYQVKWVGSSTSTWEPALVMREDAPDAVKAYETFLSNRTQARVTRSVKAVSSKTNDISSTWSSSSSSSTMQAVSRDPHDSDDDSEASGIEAARLVAAMCL